MIRTIILFIYFLGINQFLRPQNNVLGNICNEAIPLCSGISYANSSGLNVAEQGPYYGCLNAQHNPTWFYFQIESIGNIELKIEQSTIVKGTPNLDVDFILYGPFSHPKQPCFSDLNNQNVIDCSYSTAFVEFAHISNARAGEYYVLLVTNFSQKEGFITVTQTSGSASTNCVIVHDPIPISKTGCLGETVVLDASTLNAVHYVWYEEKVPGSNEFVMINGLQHNKLNVNSGSKYIAEAVDKNNVIMAVYKFEVNFFPTPSIKENLPDYILCDTSGDNDGKTEIHLSYMNSVLLNGLSQEDFAVSFYRTEADAYKKNNALTDVYFNESKREQIFARVENRYSKMACFDIGMFYIEVNLRPEIYLHSEYLLCVNLDGTEKRTTPPVIDTGLNADEYSFKWFHNGTIISNESSNTLSPTVDGEYHVEVKSKLTDCVCTFKTIVVLSPPPEIMVETMSYAFIGENTLKVNVSGTGIQDFEYRLDQNPWQKSNLFSNVSKGEHLITVRNLAGCGLSSIRKIVMDYPRYFTPNGDGRNDTWNISGLDNQPNACVNIFNRYGKLIKQFNPSRERWDGTVKGVPLPADDYWFTLNYIEPKNGEIKSFKSHFTLKR
ncbi:T9SS type B sorting domain-containing protein [Aestuariivivens sediminis]|uniref:T9SS type B sorting domain-containing protein n=1 Tax=Aestuariivivens sediminis TaxID=2913557 RepID=UPI001F5724FC|nr:T9SS type B sorting domain-containing protein [Aestuariivivens sediminis]